jgi:predicted phage terminase large subunit-like protein
VGATVSPQRAVGYPIEQIDLATKLNAANARDSFAAFRRTIRPDLLWGPFVGCLTAELQRFHEAFEAGKRPRLAIMTPPQHGKSLSVEDFIAWLAGRHSDWKTIYASYNDDLGTLRNHNLQRLFTSQRYRHVFPNLKIGGPGTRYQCNTSLIEYAGGPGSFRNTTINGPITGMEQNLGVIDDYVKGRREANSKTVRDATWSWLSDDFMTRFAEESTLLITCTRWHLDDLVGRLREKDKRLRVVEFTAIAEEDERYRGKGEPLFPELKSLKFLLERKRLMSDASWQAEYQQHPYLIGGGLFPIDLLRTIPIFDRDQIKASILSIDKAGTAGGDGAYTAIVLMHKMKNGQFVIERVVRGHWSALERETKIRQSAEIDRENMKYRYVDYKIVVEQEPGSGGKESAEATIRNLAGFTVIAYKPTGDKAVRAEPFAAQVQGDNVRLVAGQWIPDFLEEAESWPNSPQLDQIDAAAQAFNHLTMGDGYDYSYAGFQD